MGLARKKYFNYNSSIMNKVLIAVLFFGFSLGAGQPAKGGEDCSGCLPQLVDPVGLCVAEVGYLDARKIAKCVEGKIGYDNECFSQICCVIEITLNISC